MKFRKGNKILYMQDFSFLRGIPHGIDFEIEVNDDGVILRASGYGGKPYGNGAVFVKIIHLPVARRYEVVRTMGYTIPR